MKKIVPIFAAVAVMFLLTGCLNLQVGGGSKTEKTLGQQLSDLQSAKLTGAITEAEYETQKAKLLNGK